MIQGLEHRTHKIGLEHLVRPEIRKGAQKHKIMWVCQRNGAIDRAANSQSQHLEQQNKQCSMEYNPKYK